MRISDWSSDVCSSDLLGDDDAAFVEAAEAVEVDIGEAAQDAVADLAHILGASGEIAVLHRRELLRNGGDLGHHGRFGVAAVGLDAAFDAADQAPRVQHLRSEEHTSEIQSLMRNSYAVLRLKKTHTKIIDINKTN